MTHVRATGALLVGAATIALVTGCSSTDRNAPATQRSDTSASASPLTATSTSERPAETLKPLVQQALPNVKGKTFTSAIVTFPANGKALPHRHGEAFVYAYVLEGSVRSQIAGSPARTYHQGENWVEKPGAHHVLTENTDPAKPAKLLVVFVSNTGDELKTDDPQA